jgi:sodium-dependent dicarboxylate transporter 2/3/5
MLNQWLPFRLGDEEIAILATVALFITPVDWKSQRFLLEWRDTDKLPWGILLLFGGGLSLAAALKDVGLIDLIGNQFKDAGIARFWLVLGLAAVSLYLTEVMSNVALVTVFLPVVGGIATGMGIPPLLLCIPVTLAASCAFMLPMGTPPNAIVFASGHLRMTDMVKTGFWLNLVTVAVTALLTEWLIPWILGG